MNPRHVRPGSIALFLLASGLAGASELPAAGWEGRTMGSPYRVTVAGVDLAPGRVQELQSAVEARLTEINRQMSHYDPQSELSRFNRSPANVPFKVSPEFARVVRFALEVSRRSGGAFDPTLAPVINLWGFGEQSADRTTAPPADALREALASTGWQHLTVTDRDELVKDLPGLTLNLGAVAKGFGADEVTRILRTQGLTNTYVSIAGEVRVMGVNPRGTKWRLGISAPVEHWRESDPMAAAVALSDQALSTSGDYQKFFRDAEGRRFCHIMDPRTGWPVQSAIGGVSVVAPDSTTADALGTALFVLGVEEGSRFIASWTNAAALFIVREPDGRFRQIPTPSFAPLTGYHPTFAKQ